MNTLFLFFLLAPFCLTRAQHLNPQFEAGVPGEPYHSIEFHARGPFR